MWQSIGQVIVLADTNQMWSSILWFLITGAIFYWIMRMGGCGAHGHGGYGGHGGHGRRSDYDTPRSDQSDIFAGGGRKEPPPPAPGGHHH